jgi:hypothetical protein
LQLGYKITSFTVVPIPDIINLPIPWVVRIPCPRQLDDPHPIAVGHLHLEVLRAVKDVAIESVDPLNWSILLTTNFGLQTKI